jgi:hypothetical protein
MMEDVELIDNRRTSRHKKSASDTWAFTNNLAMPLDGLSFLGPETLEEMPDDFLDLFDDNGELGDATMRTEGLMPLVDQVCVTGGGLHACHAGRS